MKYDDWLVNIGSSGTYHWVNHNYEGGEEGDWNTAVVGTAFYFGSSTHTVKVDIISWKVVTGWWIWETHEDMLGGSHASVILKTANSGGGAIPT